MDNVVCAHEILFSIKKQKIKSVLFKLDFEKSFDRVHWDFLLEILEGRNFGSKWINWIKSILYSSRTCINVNGNLGEYFSCQRRVRQGDPLSPFLFDLVSDTLHRMLDKAAQEGYLKGIKLSKNNVTILNLHFVDDTLLFLEANEESIQALRWFLLGFENLSDMKIKFSKCEMIPLNLKEKEGSHLASLFGCKLGHLSLTYLGIPLHWKKNYNSRLGVFNK
jgi:Reverse transcriptase (RNA-dependent DNA polymerase)